MVLELLETLVKNGDVIVDVGCGSGILSEASRLLAPVRVIACDIDLSAISAVRSQFNFPVFLGSVDALPNESADLVLANISKKAVDALAPEIKRILKPSGHVVVGGFIRDSVPAHYQPERELQKGDWLCWLCTRGGILTDAQMAGHVLEHPLHWW
jgi:ribosomal protein L11 methyltransferase